MSLEELNAQVTAAIFDAEDQERKMQAKYRRVSELEEDIAAVTGVNTTEGCFSRRGAVSAALRAGELDRALLLIKKYQDEREAPADLVAELEWLRAKVTIEDRWKHVR